MKPLSHVLAAMMLAACSTQPHTTPSGTNDSPVRPPATAPASDGAVAASPGSSADPVDADFARVAKTYKMVEREGHQLYCRYEAPLGTRLPVEQCFTETQLKEMVRKTRDTRDRMRLPKAGPCGSVVTGCE